MRISYVMDAQMQRELRTRFAAPASAHPFLVLVDASAPVNAPPRVLRAAALASMDLPARPYASVVSRELSL